MTEDHPAAKAGTRIPHQRRPHPTETSAKEASATTPRKKSKTDIAIEEAAARLAARDLPRQGSDGDGY